MLRFAAFTLVAALGFSAQPSAHAVEAPGDELAALLALEDGPRADQGGPKRPHRRDGEKGERRERGDKGEGRPGQGEGREHLRERIMHELFEGIQLDDAQKEALKKIHEENREKREAFMKEHKDELKAFGETIEKWKQEHKAEFEAINKKLRDAWEAKDREAAQTARAELKALLESRPKMPEALKAGMLDPAKLEGQIRGILHQDQLAKFDENVKELKEKRKKFEEGGFRERPRGPEAKDGKNDEVRRPQRPGRGGPIRGKHDGNTEAQDK